jgi:hypothetical protein
MLDPAPVDIDVTPFGADPDTRILLNTGTGKTRIVHEPVDPDSVDGLIAKLQALPPDVRKLPAVVYTDNGIMECNPSVTEVLRNEFLIEPEGDGLVKVVML